MSDLPKFVHINEEGPREGFQIEKGPIPTARKVELIDALSETGLDHIQIVSFVNPKARARHGRRRRGGATASRRKPGIALHRAVAEREGPRARHRDRPARASRARSQLARLATIPQAQPEPHAGEAASRRSTISSRIYKENGVAVERGSDHGGVRLQFRGRHSAPSGSSTWSARSSIWPREHGVTLKLHLARRHDGLGDAALDQAPGRRGARAFPDLDIALHLHDTRGMGIANAYAGLEMGVDEFDSHGRRARRLPVRRRITGAAGNVCTEDLVFMCKEMGIETGVDLEQLIECAQLAEDIVGHPLPGSVMKGGSLKPLRAAAALRRTAMKLTEALGNFVADLSPNRIPDEARRVARMGFTDCIGTMIAGRYDDAPQILRRVLAPVRRRRELVFQRPARGGTGSRLDQRHRRPRARLRRRGAARPSQHRAGPRDPRRGRDVGCFRRRHADRAISPATRPGPSCSIATPGCITARAGIPPASSARSARPPPAPNCASSTPRAPRRRSRSARRRVPGSWRISAP